MLRVLNCPPSGHSYLTTLLKTWIFVLAAMMKSSQQVIRGVSVKDVLLELPSRIVIAAAEVPDQDLFVVVVVLHI